MTRILKILQLTIAALIAMPAASKAVMLHCDHCSDAQMVHLVRELASGGAMLEGTVHIADLAGDRLRAFEVRCREWVNPLAAPGDGARSSTHRAGSVCGGLTATLTSADPVYIEHFETLRDFHRETDGSLAKTYEVSSDWIGGMHGDEIAAGTAFDVAGNFGFRTRVAAALSGCTLCGRTMRNLGAAAANFVTGQGIRASITVRFRDGSESTYALTDRGAWEYVPNSSRAPDGTGIPERLEDVQSFDIGFGAHNQESAAAFIDYFTRRFRIPIIGELGGTVERISCSWNPATNTVTCTIITQPA